MIWAFDVTHAEPGFSTRFHQQALAQGLFIRPIGSTVYFMPPYVISNDECDFLVERTSRALAAALNQ